MLNTTNPGLKALSEELDRTAVISKDFKNDILGWAMHAVSHAYEQGRNFEKEKANAE